MSDWLAILAGVAASLLVLWTLFLVGLWWARPSDATLRDALRLVPDIIRLVRRLAADPALSRGVRLRLTLLLGYLLLPIDLVPDFIPVLGYADDVLAIAVVLRSVVRAAGPEALKRHWPGSPEGLRMLRDLVRM